VLLQNGNQAINFNMAAFAIEAFRVATNTVAVQAIEYFVSIWLEIE